METLDQIISDDPGSENVLKQVGEDESLDDLARTGAYLRLGLLLQALNRPEEAEASYCKAIELRPDDAGAYGDLG
jgi:tetratricopeptide (TPR) repeat protein